jgi:Ribonuclease H2 non-catalytic subunit (Ylr154p-like)
MSSIVYSMPFSIDIPSTVTSDIKRHFTNSIQINNNKLEASFRGRPLNGEHLSIPDDYIGILTNSSKTVSSFDKLTYFNLDCSTSKNDCIVRSIEWLSLAKILHE